MSIDPEKKLLRDDIKNDTIITVVLEGKQRIKHLIADEKTVLVGSISSSLSSINVIPTSASKLTRRG